MNLAGGSYDYVATHNKLCTDPDERINEKNKLKFFEKFIRHHSKLTAVKTSLDGADEIATMNGQVTLSVPARMDFYMQTAIRLDGERKERLIKSNRKANMCFGTLPIDKILDMDLSAAQALINPGVGYETFATALDDSNIETQIAEMDASYEAYTADGGTDEAGRIPHAVWSKMTKEQKSWWIKIPKDIRAHILPGTGVSSHHSRATNASFTAPASSIQGSSETTSPPEGIDRSVSFAGSSDSPIIAAMRAHSTREPTGGLHSSRRDMHVKNPLDPTRLLSSQNASDAQLRPLPRNNAAHQATSAPTERTVASAIYVLLFSLTFHCMELPPPNLDHLPLPRQHDPLSLPYPRDLNTAVVSIFLFGLVSSTGELTLVWHIQINCVASITPTQSEESTSMVLMVQVNLKASGLVPLREYLDTRMETKFS